VCKMVPYCTCVKVPYQVTEMVPCTVRRQVEVCVPYEVCVRKARYVPCEVCDYAPHCPAPCPPACKPCCPAPACAPCPTTASCNPCENACEQPCRHKRGLLRRFFHRRLCCEPTACGCN